MRFGESFSSLLRFEEQTAFIINCLRDLAEAVD